MSITIPIQAYHDYRYLRDRGFPEQASLKLVGDRYRLTRIARNCLFRGVIPTQVAELRKRKLVSPAQVRGTRLAVDWYNVLITVESYLKGSLVFIADDGILRDAASSHGSWRSGLVTPRALDALIGSLVSLGLERLEVFLDAPIAFSGELASEIRQRLAAATAPEFEVALEQSADWPLKHHKGVVASSDSVVLDAATGVLDLPRAVLADRFGFTPLHLAELASPG